MTDINLILVATPEDIRQSLATFNAEAKHFLKLARSLLHDTTYWIHDADTQLFGPAKFVGFVGMSLAKYQEARNHHYTGARFDGNVTRRAIESALQTSFAYDQHLTSKLRAWGKSLIGGSAFDGLDQSKWKFVRLPIQNSEVLDEAATEAAEAAHLKRQGFQPDSAVRHAVEEYAMKAATRHFEGLGYSVIRKGKPYDLLCTRGNSVLYVEVKGTQTDGTEIWLTRNEVRFANEHSGQMALFILCRVSVEQHGKTIGTSKGKPILNPNWTIDASRLTPLAYSYSLPPNTDL